MSDCTATIDTIFGVITCHRRDGRDHNGWHHWDRIIDGRLESRVVWNDHESGYGSIPTTRLGMVDTVR